MNLLRTFAFWLVAAALSPIAAHAQALPPPPDPATVRVRIGPLFLNPTLSLTNAGVDSNVFNVAESDAPQRDFTLTMTPAANLWLRFGRTWIGGVIREDLVWYRKFADQRSANSGYTVGWTVPLTRVAFTMAGNWVHTRERPGFEIDARSQRTEQAYSGSAELRALSKTFIGVRGERRAVNFDKAEVFLGRNLHDELNRTQTTGAVTVRHELTPLTSLTFDLSREQDRFAFSSLRDSDSTLMSLGLKFDPDALISGSAQFGYRKFEPLSANVPAYSGSTVQVNVTYIARGSTRVGLQAMRDVQYSFDVSQPYYLLTGFTTSLAQQIFGPVDVEGRVGRQRLSYRQSEAAVLDESARVDHVRSYGMGLGYHLGRELRLAFNVDNQKRESKVDRRNYSGLRYGTAITYGF
jgi:hypothetical protein